jgi:hypothetical protein
MSVAIQVIAKRRDHLDATDELALSVRFSHAACLYT